MERCACLAQDLQYGKGGILGLAPTWPQAACILPQREPDFDWEGDRPLDLPMQDLVVYEMHVRGFTRDESSRVQSPGGPVQQVPTHMRICCAASSLTWPGANAMGQQHVRSHKECCMHSQTTLPASPELLDCDVLPLSPLHDLPSYA